MFKVECLGCQAPYQVDEKRVPEKGLKMRCPKCGGQLEEIDFHHLKIDRCTDCGGVWLDKGEMEMLDHVDQSKIRGFVRSMFGLR